MLFNLLESVTESVTASTGTGTPKNNTQQIIIWIILGVVLVGFIVMNYFSDENPNYIKFDKVAIYSSEDPNEASGSDAHEEDIMPVSDPEETKEKVEEGLAEEKTEEEKSEEDKTENKE